ncbi:MAG: alpha-L-fucosidase [Desulfobacula sp.]|nr:alpha-L-fucosidase [Desulfobacula sp.]
MKKLYLFLIFAVVFYMTGFKSVCAQSVEADSTRFEWFGDAKLGLFIHWGIYAVNGIDESWSFFNGYISHDDYMKQLDGFTADKYKPEEWTNLIKESGAKYAVITSKHHDGVALWDSKFSDLNVVRKTPAGSDLLQPLIKSLRKEKIKAGIYYSLLDWSHPDYPNCTRTENRYEDDLLLW